jgi:hypothetical protein
LAAGVACGFAAPGAAVAFGFTGTLFAGIPLAVGGAEAPTLGALGVVTFGLFAGAPGAAALDCGRLGFG